MPAAPASDAVPGGVHVPPLETGIQAVWLFAVSRGPRTAARSASSPRSALPRHAAVPSRFPVQVGRAAQRSPPPEPLPPAGAIQRRVRRRTLSRHRALLTLAVRLASTRRRLPSASGA